MTFSKKADSWWYLPVKIIFLAKTKMVRMVHMNIFYKMDLQICDPQSEFLAKIENIYFLNMTIMIFKTWKISVWGPQNRLPRLLPRPKWLFPILKCLATCFHSTSFFYQKTKGSVWSIWTYSTRWILNCVTEKVSFGRKLKIEDFEKMKKCSGVQNSFLRLYPRPKCLLKIFWTIPQSSRLNVHI